MDFFNGFSPSWHNFVEFIMVGSCHLTLISLCVAYIGEEMRLKQVSTSYKDEDNGPDIVFISKVRRGGRRGAVGRCQKSKEEESFLYVKGRKT